MEDLSFFPVCTQEQSINHKTLDAIHNMRVDQKGQGFRLDYLYVLSFSSPLPNSESTEQFLLS